MSERFEITLDLNPIFNFRFIFLFNYFKLWLKFAATVNSGMDQHELIRIMHAN